MTINVVFMGSPDFAVPCLNAIHDHPDINVVGVVSQPDKPAGRGRKLTPPPVAARAHELQLQVYQPPGLRKAGRIDPIAKWEPDIIVVVAYGKILPRDLLDIPPRGCVNVHASLLPRHRGASPIHQAILQGDEKTGVALMQMEEGLDTGPVFAEAILPLTHRERTPEVADELSKLGAALLSKHLPALAKGELEAVPQSETGVTHAPLITKRDGFLSPLQPVEFADRQVRAYDPWPGTFMMLKDTRLKVFEIAITPGEAIAELGEVVSLKDGKVSVQWSNGLLHLLDVHPAGRKRTLAHAWIAGRGVSVGDRFSLNAP